MFLSADTVYLVRHEPTGGIGLVDKETGKKLPLSPLLVKGKPNYSIWRQSKILQDTALRRLAKILSRPYRSKSHVVETCNCIPMPLHTIFIVKGGKTSFITVAFFGLGIKSSKNVPLEYFDERKWNELDDFITQQGITIKFDE